MLFFVYITILVSFACSNACHMHWTEGLPCYSTFLQHQSRWCPCLLPGMLFGCLSFFSSFVFWLHHRKNVGFSPAGCWRHMKKGIWWMFQDLLFSTPMMMKVEDDRCDDGGCDGSGGWWNGKAKEQPQQTIQSAHMHEKVVSSTWWLVQKAASSNSFIPHLWI